MMSRFTVAFLALVLCALPAVPSLAQPLAPPAAPQAASPAWDVPPAEFQSDKMQRKAFKDGIQAAQSDRLMHRKMDYKKSENYLHPPKVHKADRGRYRNAFQMGYAAALRHAGYR